MTKLSSLRRILPLFLVYLYYTSKCDATTYLVGGNGGWDPSTDLDSWVANKTFHAGDMLWFMYSRYHSVSEVDKAGYESCNTTNAILTGTIGNTNVTLKSPGTNYYFISGKPLYCFGGMRITTYVQKGNGSAIAAPAVSPVTPKVQPRPPPSVSRHSDSDNISPSVTGNNVINGYGNGEKDVVNLGAVLLAFVFVLLY